MYEEARILSLAATYCLKEAAKYFIVTIEENSIVAVGFTWLPTQVST